MGNRLNVRQVQRSPTRGDAESPDFVQPGEEKGELSALYSYPMGEWRAGGAVSHVLLGDTQ